MLTTSQRHQLTQYSVYLQPAGPVLFHTGEWKEHLTNVQEIIQAPHKTAAASYLTRRLGLFLSMQFWNLTLYDERWVGDVEDLQWMQVREYGNPAISAFVQEEHYVPLQSDAERRQAVEAIWSLAEIVISSLSPSSAIQQIHWENIFGYTVWHYSVFLQQADLWEKALKDWMLLQEADLGEGANKFSEFVAGRSAVDLTRVPVRLTCCLAKDIPGQLKCGFCPID